MFFCMLLLVIAVVLAIPVFTGKGRLMSTENIKKDKVKTYQKGLRILYAIMFVVVLISAFFNLAEKVAYTPTHYYEFTEDYQGADGLVHSAGESHTADEMRQILLPTETSGSMCAPASTDPLPYKYTGTTYTLSEKYSFMGFISYQTAHVLNFISLGISMAVIFILFIFINRMTDKNAQKKNSQAKKKNNLRPSMPKGAFDFSEYKDEVEVTPDRFSEDLPEQSNEEKPAKKKKR